MANEVVTVPALYVGRTRKSPAEAWLAGYQHGVAQCNHHPEAMTTDAVNAIVASERRKAEILQSASYEAGHTQGRRDEMNDKQLTTEAFRKEFKRGKDYERNALGEWLILQAQELGHAQFVFTREDLDGLKAKTNDIVGHLSRIETLR